MMTREEFFAPAQKYINEQIRAGQEEQERMDRAFERTCLLIENLTLERKTATPQRTAEINRELDRLQTKKMNIWHELTGL